MNLAAVIGIPASVAGTAMAQASGSDIDRAKADTAAQRRATTSEIHAEKAAGIGEADGEDHTINDRDADGRQAWDPGSGVTAQPSAAPSEEDAESRQSRDPSGASGGELDITG